MQYKPLKQSDRIEKAIILTNRIIVKALQSNRGYKIRGMNEADLKGMVESVFNAVYNQLAVESQRAYECKCDKSAEFKPRSDDEIEKEVTAYFEINGKLQYLQYREVKFESFIDLPVIDKSVDWLTQQMKMGELGMRYNPYSLADRLEKAGILADAEIMSALQDWDSDAIREMRPADFKQMWKGVFSLFYHGLYAEAEDGFEEACEEYVPERDGIENDPRKTFRPKTEFEIDQEIKAYFEEQGTLHQSR